jgi:predicted nucleic acid-binding protein
VTVFVDTSALYALVDEDDGNHTIAGDALHALRGRTLVTHTYVVVETLALVARRLPWAATERVMDVFLPLLEVYPVDDTLHRAAGVEYRASGSPAVSFVDRTSFAFMRHRGIEDAFAYDDDFERNGFTIASRREPAVQPSLLSSRC